MTRHASDCAVHNEPYKANGPCDCGADAKHTPGPWQSKDDYTREGLLTIIANLDGEYFTDRAAPVMTYDVIAICEDEYGESLPNAAANARLIIASPDLLAALRVARDFIETEVEMRGAAGSSASDYQSEAQDAYDRVCAAIAKAVG